MTTTKNSNATDKETAERRKIIDEIIRKAYLDQAIDFARANEASRDVIEERFMKDLRYEILKIKDVEIDNSCVEKGGNTKKAEKIIELLNLYKIYPNELIHETVKFLLRYNHFYENVLGLAKLGAQETKELVAKTFFKKNINLNNATELRGRNWSSDELKDYLDLMENNHFLPSEDEFIWD